MLHIFLTKGNGEAGRGLDHYCHLFAIFGENGLGRQGATRR
jgi:hypothetical protein